MALGAPESKLAASTKPSLGPAVGCSVFLFLFSVPVVVGILIKGADPLPLFFLLIGWGVVVV